MSSWNAIITSAPINRAARQVVSQRGAAREDADLSRYELLDLLRRLERKQRLLKKVLGIQNKSQHTNFVNALKGKKYGSGVDRAYNNPRSAVEYKRVGEDIQRIIRRISDIKLAAKAARAEAA